MDQLPSGQTTRERSHWSTTGSTTRGQDTFPSGSTMSGRRKSWDTWWSTSCRQKRCRQICSRKVSLSQHYGSAGSESASLVNRDQRAIAVIHNRASEALNDPVYHQPFRRMHRLSLKWQQRLKGIMKCRRCWDLVICGGDCAHGSGRSGSVGRVAWVARDTGGSGCRGSCRRHAGRGD